MAADVQRPRAVGTRRALILAASLLFIVVLAAARGPLLDGSDLLHRDGGFVGAATCRECHAEQHASWSRTFHSTMTREASPESVVGAFDGREVRYGGQTARPFARDGRFYIELPNGADKRVAEVALAVGSRRYQQYFEREARGSGFAFMRLPILWHIEQGRWLHLNGVFLGPDDDDWNLHRAEWNTNCILCHNTAPQPRRETPKDRQELARPEFHSKVADLGIACESCHGPAAQHVAVRRAERDSAASGGAKVVVEPSADPIVDPRDLDPLRSIGVCAQCHGQRLPRPLTRGREWMVGGPTYRAGDSLGDHVEFIHRDTPVHGNVSPDLFEARFWPDGTPRLTAYEAQGLVASECFTRGGLTCLDCHTMHSGDVRGQLEPRKRTNQACTGCHAKIAADVTGHTHHAADSPGSACMDCHMPRIVFGVVDIHRSHRIERPDPARDVELGRPSACTLCHLDRDSKWAAEQTATLWEREPRLPIARADGIALEVPESIASLMGGDAAQRAVYAAAYGRPEVALAPRDKAFLRVLLAVAMGDGYPGIRTIAQRSQSALEAELPIGIAARLASVDPMAGADARRAAVLGLLNALRELAPGKLAAPPAGRFVDAKFQADLPALIALMAHQASRLIAIGE